MRTGQLDTSRTVLERMTNQGAGSAEKFFSLSYATGAQRDIEQGAFPGCLVVRDGSFVEVAEIVKFVAVDALQLPARGAGPGVRRERIDGARENDEWIVRRCDRGGATFDESSPHARVREFRSAHQSLSRLFRCPPVERRAKKRIVPRQLLLGEAKLC